MALTYTPDSSLGMKAPAFTLPGTDGRTYSLQDLDGAKARLVMFICNHCPYVIAIEDRLRALAASFGSQPVKIVAISSNDANVKPADSFEKMKEKNYSFPYLHDESQEVARAYGAVCTPDFFLFDETNTLVYRGRLDDSWKDAQAVTHQELKDAIEALLKGQMPSPLQRPSMGCSIKWKPETPT
jgi:peroxiredoxin